MEANHWKEYFHFSKKERTGIITLLILIVLVWFLPMLFSPAEKIDTRELELFKKEIALYQQQSKAVEESKAETASENNKAYPPVKLAATAFTLFYFDPNTLPAEDWKQLGLQDKTIKTILNYTSKGGKFYKAEDLGRIYGLRKNDYERLLPYVRIAGREKKKEAPLIAAEIIEKTKHNEIKPININTADTTAFIFLPGIGSKLAQRIVSFRQKLGGFYAVEQMAQVYGLPDSTFQKIKPTLICNAAEIQKININTATIEVLKAHPYMKYQLANAVIQYRNQHGNFKSIEDLKMVQVITEDIFRKVAPYLVAP